MRMWGFCIMVMRIGGALNIHENNVSMQKQSDYLLIFVILGCNTSQTYSWQFSCMTKRHIHAFTAVTISQQLELHSPVHHKRPMRRKSQCDWERLRYRNIAEPLEQAHAERCPPRSSPPSQTPRRGKSRLSGAASTVPFQKQAAVETGGPPADGPNVVCDLCSTCRLPGAGAPRLAAAPAERPHLSRTRQIALGDMQHVVIWKSG